MTTKHTPGPWAVAAPVRAKPPRSRAFLDCPECSTPLIPAHGRGRHDQDGNYVEHRDGCRCPWCDWAWFDDADPVTCACGAVVGVKVDEDYAYATMIEEPRHLSTHGDK